MTDLQKAMLKKIARSEYTPVNGAEPEDIPQATTWADIVLETNADKGVFTSLLRIGLVWHSGDKGRDAAVGLTAKGFEAYKSLS